MKNCIYIDETGFSLNMSRDYAWSPKGKRAYSKRDTRKGKRISVVGAVSSKKMLSYMFYEGSMNGEVFYNYVKNFLLKHLNKNKIVILDNLSAHKNKEALNLIAEKGVQILFLPPYLPVLNAIEYCWSIIKNNIKKIKPITKEEVITSFISSLTLITPKKIIAFFRHCRA